MIHESSMVVSHESWITTHGHSHRAFDFISSAFPGTDDAVCPCFVSSIIQRFVRLKAEANNGDYPYRGMKYLSDSHHEPYREPLTGRV